MSSGHGRLHVSMNERLTSQNDRPPSQPKLQFVVQCVDTIDPRAREVVIMSKLRCRQLPTGDVWIQLPAGRPAGLRELTIWSLARRDMTSHHGSLAEKVVRPGGTCYSIRQDGEQPHSTPRESCLGEGENVVSLSAVPCAFRQHQGTIHLAPRKPMDIKGSRMKLESDLWRWNH